MIQDDCLCPMDENETITRFALGCPLHKHLAPPASEIKQPWCQGSSETVDILSKRTGRCRRCRLEVPQKYGIAGVHLRDGSTPRE